MLSFSVDELGEGGGDPDAGLRSDTLERWRSISSMTMARSDFRRGVTGLVQVHKDRDERGLAVGGHQGDDLILDGLHALDFSRRRFSTIRRFFPRRDQCPDPHLGLDIAADLSCG